MRKTIPTAEERLDELKHEEVRQQRVLEGHLRKEPKSLHLLALGILALLIAAVLAYVIGRP